MNIEKQERINFYQSNINDYAAKIKLLETNINRLSILRLIFVLVAAVAFYLTLGYGSVFLTLFSIFATIILFAFLIMLQSKQSTKRDHFLDFKRINENELTMIMSNQNFYNDGSKWIDDHHHYSSDLDLFGEQSLYSMVNRCSTLQGNARLAGIMKDNEPIAINEVKEKQKALKELSSLVEFRQNFQSFLLFSKDSTEDYFSKLVSYSKAAPVLISKNYLIYINLLTLLIGPLVVAAVFFPAGRILLLITLIVNTTIYMLNSKLIRKTAQQILGMEQALMQFKKVFSRIETQNFQSKYCIDLVKNITDKQSDSFSSSFERLSKLVSRFLKAENPFGTIILNGFFLWNLKNTYMAEEIRKEHLGLVDQALDTIAQLEALLSLSTLYFNNPDWAIPTLTDEEGYTYDVVKMAHPLIPENNRVTNSFSLVNERKIDIITGSNMAGKSTFLRTLGINAVLAFCGAPVCAESMKISNFRIFTYMRIKDSLQKNTSTFKMEIDRIESLLNLIQQTKVYFLVDEMLRGTNSLDKFRGSKAMIHRLIEDKSAGIIATHDHQLTTLVSKYPDYLRTHYFDVTIDNGEATFDYTLKPGECRNYNASFMLERIGLTITELT
ncbi:MutS domain V [Pedobacter steynii]|uniref:MutS domain V n=1 Tax=Pedobacter steynii TaxID=430522 RepID=A0A1G9UD15_9SPHI|nr:hypothetical protein [Pedobacter steynii]NQX40734.1 hypothetical protein [Pedobacter steynii]SDM57809.1 MutS domain V [Pedobacter steynii]